MDNSRFKSAAEAVSSIEKRLPVPRRSYYYQPGFYPPLSYWQRNKGNIVVGGVIGLCSTVFVGSWWADQRAKNLHDHGPAHFLGDNFVCSLRNVREGRWWVMLTSSVTHFGVIHFGLNMMGLLSFGRLIVRTFGAPAFFGIWTVSGLCCSIAGLVYEHRRLEHVNQSRVQRWDTKGRKEQQQKRWFAPAYNLDVEPVFGGSIGASGSLFGLVAVVACLNPRSQILIFPIPVPMPMWVALVGGTAFSLYCLDTGTLPQIGHAGHLGGIASGLVSYFAVLRPWFRRSGRLWYWLSPDEILAVKEDIGLSVTPGSWRMNTKFPTTTFGNGTSSARWLRIIPLVAEEKRISWNYLFLSKSQLRYTLFHH